MTDLKSVSDTFLNKSILRKALDLFTNKFIKKTDNSILNKIVGLVRKVRSVNTILNKLSSRIPLNKKERKFFANHEAFFNYVRNAENQVSYSKSIDNVNNQEVNYTYERTNEFRELQEESRNESFESVKEQGTYATSDERLRTRLSTILQGQLERGGINSSNYELLNLNSNKNTTFNIYENVNPSIFHDIFEVVRKYTPNGELVDLHEDYNGISCYLSSDGSSGFAIESDGNLISVFNANNKRGFLDAISQIVKEKATHLDCYASQNQNLQEMYTKKFGFKTTSIMDYNMEYDHDNIAVNHNEPQVAFMVNTSEEVETRHFNKDQYDEAQEYQLSYVNKQNANSVDLSKVKIGSNGKIVRDNITEPLFEIANGSINIAKDNFNFIKKELFTDIAAKYNLSLEITDINGNKLDDPSIKSLSSFADRLYRNAIGKGINPNQVKDWVRGTFIFNNENISNVRNVIEDLRPYLTKIDIKNKSAYKGIHLNLKYNNIPVEIQLHTQNSWKLKTQSDLFYEQYRSYNDLENQLSKEEYKKYLQEKRKFEQKWNQILEERDFKALRAEVSSVKNSMSSSLGSISENATGDLVATQDSPSNSLNGNSDVSNNLPVGVNTNSLSSINNTSFSTDTIQQVVVDDNTNSQEITPFETNKAKKIKDYANQRLGKVISLTDTSKVYNQIVDYIYANFGASVKNVNEKVRALFEEYNVVTDYSYNDFANDLLDSEINISSNIIGEEIGKYTLRDYLQNEGIDTSEVASNISDLLNELLDYKANDSQTTKLFKRAEENFIKAANRIQELKNFAKNYANLASKIKILREQLKLPNNFEIDIRDEASALKYLVSGRVFTRNGGISGSIRTRLHKLLENDYFNKLKDNTNFNEYEDFGDALDIFESIANTYDSNRKVQKILTVAEGEQLIAAYSKVIKTLQDYKNGVFSEVEKIATQSANEQNILYKVKRNGTFRNRFIKFINKIANPLSVFSAEFGGKDSTLYKATIQKGVDAYINEQMDEANLTNEFQKVITKNSVLVKEQNKIVSFLNYKIPKYNLYALYLNANSINAEDLYSAGFTLKGLRNGNRPHLKYTSETYVLVENALTQNEKNELDKLSNFLNTTLKEYVRKAQIKDIGYSTMIEEENYYPKFTDSGTLNRQLNDPTNPSFMIDASAWNSLKLRTGKKTRIELNNPLAVVNTYIESASKYANLTMAQRTINRIFNKRINVNGIESLRDLFKQRSGVDILAHLTSWMNKLQGNDVRVNPESLVNKWGGRFATATLGLNISSALKQIGSLPTTAQKTGILNQYKSLVNLDTYKVKEIDKYLRENNGLYAMRIKNHGYVNSQTFANEVSRFSSKFLNKVIETSLLPLEYSDRLWCIISFGSCVESAYNEYNGKYARNSNEVLSRANSLFNDVLLETQSNAYAISTSMLRSGELGPIARWVFGTFASDSQNKVSLLYETVSNYFNNRSLIRYLENEVGTNTKLSQDEINDYNEKLNSLRSKQPKLRASMYRNAYTLVASAVLTYAVSLLARYLLGKDKEEDYEVGNLTAGFMQELFVDWLPFISTFSNNIQYNDGKFELMPLENVSAVISDLYNVINQLASGKALTMGNITTLLVDFTNFFGVPLKNAYNIVYGIIDKFSPKTAFEMNNALYSYSQSYIERMQNDALSKGHFKDGKLYLSENITLYKTGSLSNALINEIATLKNKGFNAIPKNALTSYFDENDNEIELTDLEKQTFVGYYNEVDDVATNLIRSAKYNALTDEEKAELLKKLFDYYYGYAKNMTLYLNEGSRFVKAMTLIDNFDISKYLFLKGETKEESVKEVNKIFGTRNERLLALFLLGYNLTNENKKVLYRYLITLGLNRNTAKEWVRIE